MFDLFLTLALIYLAYRGYNWYSDIQARVQGEQQQVDDEEVTINSNPAPSREDDYIDYEEVE